MVSKHTIKAYAFLMVSIVTLGLLPLAMAQGGKSLGVVSFAFYTFLVAAVTSFAILLPLGKLKELEALAKSGKPFIKLSICGAMYQGGAALLLTIGILHTSASVGGVVYRSWVLLTVLFIPVILKIKVTPYQIISLFIGFLAIYLALTRGTLLSINPSYAPYIIILLMASVSVAIAYVFTKSQNNDINVQVFVFNAASLILMALVVIGTGTHLNFNIDQLSLLSILFAGGIAYGMSLYFYFYGLKALDATVVSNTTMLIPFLTFGFAHVLLNEPIYPYYLILAGLVVAGVLIQRMSPKKAPERVQSRNLSQYLQIFDVTSAFANTKSQVVNGYIKGNNRALGIIGETGARYEEAIKNGQENISAKYNCLLFTTSMPTEHVSRDELDFINDILGLKAGKIALIGIGQPENVELALREVHFGADELVNKNRKIYF